MNKNRLEAFSDGVFSIIMTLLVINIAIPHLSNPSNWALLHALFSLWHTFAAYFLSVGIISMYWLNHNSLFHFHAKTVDRSLLQLNMIYLAFLSLIPFTTALIGAYPELEWAIICYGMNILIVSLIGYSMNIYIWKSPTIENGNLTSYQKHIGKLRISIVIFFTLLGMTMSHISYILALSLYIFPIVINTIPWLLPYAIQKIGYIEKLK